MCCMLQFQHYMHAIQCCVIRENEWDDWVCQNSLGSCWWSAFCLFHLCCSFRMQTLGVMPVSLHSTLIINNPLELCSFYRNNRRACLSNLYSNSDSSAVHLIISVHCALIGQSVKNDWKCNGRIWSTFVGFLRTNLTNSYLGLWLYITPVCWRMWLGWWLCFPAHRNLFDQLNQDVFVLCVFVSTVWVWKYFESSWHPIRESPIMTSN